MTEEQERWLEDWGYRHAGEWLPRARERLPRGPFRLVDLGFVAGRNLWHVYGADPAEEVAEKFLYAAGLEHRARLALSALNAAYDDYFLESASAAVGGVVGVSRDNPDSLAVAADYLEIESNDPQAAARLREIYSRLRPQKSLTGPRNRLPRRTAP